jgi:pyruvyltransferase
LSEHCALRVAIYNHAERFPNFGDLLAPMIIEGILGQSVHTWDVGTPSRPSALLSVGSILHLAKSGDGVWGSGARYGGESLAVRDVEVFAVRGPLTAEQVQLSGGPKVECFGDPGLLLSRMPVFQEMVSRLRPAGRVSERSHYCIIPHYAHFSVLPKRIQLAMRLQRQSVRAQRSWLGRQLGVSQLGGQTARWISPFQSLEHILSTILTSRMTVSSSLHGLITACSFGVPFRWWWPLIPGVAPDERGQFKYKDFLASLQCGDHAFGRTVEECLSLGTHVGVQLPSMDALVDALPAKSQRIKYSDT